MHRIRLLVVALVGSATLAPALAQDIPADQSCGGLLCDVGILGHKVEPAPPAPPPVAVAPVAPVRDAPQPVAAGVPREPSRRHVVVRKAPRPVAQRAPVAPPVAVAARPVPVPAAPVVAAAPAPARAAPPPEPTPVYTGPTVIFQSIDPRFQLDP